jgi:N-glycosylase/DNA lyase
MTKDREIYSYWRVYVNVFSASSVLFLLLTINKHSKTFKIRKILIPRKLERIKHLKSPEAVPDSLFL